MEQKIKDYKEQGLKLKQEIIDLIKPFIKDNWLYFSSIDLKDEYGNFIRGIAVREDSLFFQNENACEYSLLSFSIDELYSVYLYVSK